MTGLARFQFKLRVAKDPRKKIVVKPFMAIKWEKKGEKKNWWPR